MTKVLETIFLTEKNVNFLGKSVRRRAASMETSKYEKRRGRAKKRVEALRNAGLSGKPINKRKLHIFVRSNYISRVIGRNWWNK